MTSPSEKKVVIVGAGRFGRHYINRATQHEHFKLVGVVDSNASVLRSVQAEGISVATNIQSALDFVEHDAVIICTTADSHVTLAMQALAAGKHVLVSKPGVTTLTDYEQVSALADKNEVDWSVDYTMIGAPEVNFLDISFCAYGEPLFVDAERHVAGSREEVGEVFGLMSHDVALIDYHMPQNKQVTHVSVWQSTPRLVVASLVSGDKQIALLKASYEASHQTQAVTFLLNPYKKIKDPITQITWDQTTRRLNFNTEWEFKYDVEFESFPDPITLSLDRFYRRIINREADEDHLPNALFYSTHQGHQPTRRITRILAAMQKSLTTKQELVPV